MQKHISDISTIELKSLAYDAMAQIEMSQNNLRMINQELAKRVQQENQPAEPDPQYPPNWPPKQVA